MDTQQKFKFTANTFMQLCKVSTHTVTYFFFTEKEQELWNSSDLAQSNHLLGCIQLLPLVLQVNDTKHFEKALELRDESRPQTLEMSEVCGRTQNWPRVSQSIVFSLSHNPFFSLSGPAR